MFIDCLTKASHQNAGRTKPCDVIAGRQYENSQTYSLENNVVLLFLTKTCMVAENNRRGKTKKSFMAQ